MCRPTEGREAGRNDGMTAHDLTFGVFIPQGWKMELVSIEEL